MFVGCVMQYSVLVWQPAEPVLTLIEEDVDWGSPTQAHVFDTVFRRVVKARNGQATLQGREPSTQ